MAKFAVILLALVASTLSSPAPKTWYQIEPLIVGGVDSEPYAFPWIISLRLNGMSHNCGGTIIKDDDDSDGDGLWIMTAAHCVTSANINTLAIVAGVHRLTVDEDSTWQTRNVVDIIIHPGYQDNIPGASWTDDIALLKLDSPLIFNDKVRPIKLADKTFRPDTGDTAIAMGWGRLYADGPLPDKLQKIENFPIVGDPVCRRSYAAYNDVTDAMLCAGFEEGKNVCSGDSGSPLASFDDVSGEWVVSGIASWTMICALQGFPGVYTEVSYFRDWITENKV